ncbi:MAG: Cyanophycin synthase [Candidatus Saccharibacteria bacterium]|nr:Cyanophycin synthase [Candidatus Saccharibacteria bacterium]
MAAALTRGWEVEETDPRHSFYTLKHSDGNRQWHIRNITSVKTSALSTIIADRKDLFFELCEPLDFPLPPTVLLEKSMSLDEDFLNAHGTVVVKPTNQAHGKGVSVGITSQTHLDTAVQFARSFSSRVMIQKHITGNDYRLLFVDNKLAAAAIRRPAFVIGDGERTIRELIEVENASQNRSKGYQATLTEIDTDAAERFLGKVMSSVPAYGEEVQAVGTANIGRGGVAIDVTDTIDPEIVAIGQGLVDHFGMGLCGVDIIIDEEGRPYVIEINTGPSLGLHEFPFEGKARDTPNAYLDWLAKP